MLKLSWQLLNLLWIVKSTQVANSTRCETPAGKCVKGDPAGLKAEEAHATTRGKRVPRAISNR